MIFFLRVTITSLNGGGTAMVRYSSGGFSYLRLDIGNEFAEYRR